MILNYQHLSVTFRCRLSLNTLTWTDAQLSANNHLCFIMSSFCMRCRNEVYVWYHLQRLHDIECTCTTFTQNFKPNLVYIEAKVNRCHLRIKRFMSTWKFVLYRLGITHWPMGDAAVILVLTLNVRGPSYLGLTRLISWLLMPGPPLRRQDISRHDIEYVK